MREKECWKLFEMTGMPSAYLLYTKKKRDKARPGEKQEYESAGRVL